MLAQPSMYAPNTLNTFWKPSPSGQLVKMEPTNDVFAPHDFAAFPGSQPMMASMSLPNYATHAPDRRFNFSDAESFSSVASPSSTSDASSRPSSAKRGSKRKNVDVPAAVATPEAAADTAKASKKASRQTGQRRPPPSASHVTESGKPFPVIDTSAKHSSLFVAPDTSGLTKREARLVKNRAAAFLSRQRKREQFEEMEIKCKGISMLVWRMWEAIAGNDADVDRINETPLAAVLANEEPMARLCLEEVIAKKGASIAPTADELEGTPAPELPPHLASHSAAAAPAPAPAQAASSAELEQARSELTASLQRENELLAQLDALRASVANVQSSLPVADFHSMDVTATHASLAANMGVTSMPFKGVQAAELPLFVPESPLSKFTLGGDAYNTAMKLDASHTANFDLSKTPTLAMFSENALRSRSAQQYGSIGNVAATGMGLGLDYRFPCASAPSSPSTASTSSSSIESRQSRANSLVSRHTASPGKAPSTLASVLLLAGMSLMGVGPSANELATAEASANVATTPARKQARASRRPAGKANQNERAASTPAAGQPSSHLSDDDLLMEMGLDSASLSDDDDLSSGACMQSGSALAVSCT
ncbi:hypothetical protein PHSY_005592 [Pseudozyma hubeiensis SY62]|uniref:BZIP domain-containing protein n=1 Tax=Pseudozyma hubeiensis (strain SY62) TaxID=1305764 RepID=R9P9H8_PSEHS|nr:hypothetical protein PHSY_005592 [Pseudozyma hubeiensis SY62]GAC98004.1 hypothetical protein PHSY_005592 [Pseudozyma hubeiensis SY62]